MRVLITGAAGRIGARLTEAVLSHGHSVRAFVLPGDGSRWAGQPDVEVAEGRLEDADGIAAAVEGTDAIVHLAGALSSRGCTDRQFIDYNVTGTFNLLAAARDRAPDLQRFVYASSDAVYWHGGTALACYLPVDEVHPRLAGTVYGASKICAEELCFSFMRQTGVPVTVARFSATADAEELVLRDSVFGRRTFVGSAIEAYESAGSLDPGDAAALSRLRELDSESEGLFAFTDESGRPPTFSVNDARDAADCALRLLENPAAVGEAFNIGPIAPYEQTVLVAYLAAKLTLPWTRIPVPGQRPSWYVSSLKARMLLGYQPTRTVFDMIDEALDGQPGGEEHAAARA
jgi:UDP-glucose 4-epimerase